MWQFFIFSFVFICFSDYDSDDRYAVSHNENDNPDEDYIDKSGGREGGDNRGKLFKKKLIIKKYFHNFTFHITNKHSWTFLYTFCQLQFFFKGLQITFHFSENMFSFSKWVSEWAFISKMWFFFEMCFHFQNVKRFVSILFPFSE